MATRGWRWQHGCCHSKAQQLPAGLHHWRSHPDSESQILYAIYAMPWYGQPALLRQQHACGCMQLGPVCVARVLWHRTSSLWQGSLLHIKPSWRPTRELPLRARTWASKHATCLGQCVLLTKVTQGTKQTQIRVIISCKECKGRHRAAQQAPVQTMQAVPSPLQHHAELRSHQSRCLTSVSTSFI